MPTKYDGTKEERRALNAYITLSRASSSLNARLEPGLGEAELTVPQFGVLEALHHCGPLLAGELAAKLLCSCGNVTAVVMRLEERKLVKRKRRAEDARRVEVALTTPGRALIARILPLHVARIVEAFAVLEVEEQEQLRGLCRKLGRGR